MKNNFPNKIPIFPLSGVIYFPKTNLPLNIFEKRYLQLVDDIMKNDKYMGMIQSKENSNQVYKVGCLGKVSDFKKTADGRVLLNLTGIIRFEIISEIDNGKNYREFEVFYDKLSVESDSDGYKRDEIDNRESIYVWKKVDEYHLFDYDPKIEAIVETIDKEYLGGIDKIKMAEKLNDVLLGI